MLFDGFSRKPVFCPSFCSSLALARDDPRLARDELHRSPREPFPFASRVILVSLATANNPSSPRELRQRAFISHTSHFTTKHLLFFFSTLCERKRILSSSQKLFRTLKPLHINGFFKFCIWFIIKRTTRRSSCLRDKGKNHVLGRMGNLNIQSESPVDFDSLAANGCDIGMFYEKQGLGRYFNLLNGPTYQTLVRHFWVRASIYDRKAAKIEEDEKVLLNPELKGKSRAEMGLETFSKTQIRSSIMGIRVWITEDTIAFVIRRPAEGEHEAGISKPKDSPWNAIVNRTLYNKVKNFAYADMNSKTKVMLKIQNENLLPKGGGNDQPSLEHKILLHFVIKGVEANIPRYIFRHMVHQLRESQLNNRTWVPYGRLLSEIFHQGGIIEMLKEAQIFTDEQLGTVRGKIINGDTLKAMHLIKAKDVKKSPTDLKPSDAKSDLIPDFPPICKQDPLEVQRAYIMDHYKTYNQKISLKDVPDQMYGGALPVAKGRKSKTKPITKEEYLAGDASEKGAQKQQKGLKLSNLLCLPFRKRRIRMISLLSGRGQGVIKKQQNSLLLNKLVQNKLLLIKLLLEKPPRPKK
ncbi:hypothetical protein MTR_0454s0020 [Medicago truncatula]|uniref:Uncharacterized protein n=1 Tax=Medicago truncatula TaxID=3880 RepID=A0A072TEE0_MEDTR|nr:hypothetical protein MTR_0454s0020 [Medicago truncatula]